MTTEETKTQPPDPFERAMISIKRGAVLVMVMALAGVWQSLWWPIALVITLIIGFVAVLWFCRAGLREFFDAMRGITPAAAQQRTPARAVAHRSEPLDQLSITMTPEQAGRMAAGAPVIDATVALALPAVEAPPVAGTPILLADVLAYINRQPQQVPHLAVIGASGSGKTTFATATLHDREGQIVVITAKEGDAWGGLSYIGIDDDATYTTANDTFRVLAAEMRRRLVAVKRKQSPGAPLNVILDDYSTLRKLCTSADDFFLLAARLGRSLHVRLVVLSDTALVKAWGIEGEGETRANFAFVRLARNRQGTLETEAGDRAFATSYIPQIASLAQLAPRGWERPRPAVEVLAQYLGIAPAQLSSVSPACVPVQPVVGGALAADCTSTVPYGTSGTSPDETPNTGGMPLPMDDEAVMIRNLLQDYSKNKVAALLGGSKTTAYDRIDRALGEK